MHPLSLIDACESGVFDGSKRPVKFLAGIFLISLGIKTGNCRGQKELILIASEITNSEIVFIYCNRGVCYFEGI